MEARPFDVPGSVRLHDVSRPAPGETPDERTFRLAQKAVIEGVRIIHERGTGALIATSARGGSGTNYRVDLEAESCTCPGFLARGYCKHLSLAKIEADAVAAQPVTCPECNGRRGEKISTGGYLSDWIWRTCSTCKGAGVVTASDRIAS